MSYSKLLGWGVVIYAVMYLLVAALSIYQAGPMLVRLLAAATLIVLASIAGHSIRRRSAWDILPFALVWTLEVAALDAVMSVPFSGWQLYLDWNVWVGYSLVFVVPLISVSLSRRLSARTAV